MTAGVDTATTTGMHLSFIGPTCGMKGCDWCGIIELKLLSESLQLRRLGLLSL